MKVDKEKLIQTINSQWITKSCPMCNQNDWSISNDVMTMVKVGEKNDIQLGGKITPVVPVICNHCGNTVLINPLAINCTID